MFALYHATLAVHIAAAVASSVLFWIPVFASKSSRLHRSAGRLTVKSIVLMAATGLVLTALNLVDPVATGTVDEYNARAVIVEAPDIFGTPGDGGRPVRLNAIWLGYLSLLLMAGVRHGVRVVRTKHDHAALGRPLDLAVAGSIALSGIAMIVTGWQVRFELIWVFGIIGIASGASWLAFMLRTPSDNRAWTIHHLSVMLSVGIAMYASLLLAVGRHLPGPVGSWRMWPAALSVLGIPAILATRRFYQTAPRSLAAQTTIARHAHRADNLQESVSGRLDSRSAAD